MLEAYSDIRRTNPVPTVNALASPLYKDFDNGKWCAVLFFSATRQKFYTTMNKKESPARAKNEQTEVITFQFSENKQEVRNVFIGETPYFVGTDVCNVLGHTNSRKALRDHCRYVTKSYVPHPQSPQKQLEVSVIPESDVYRLIMKSTLPSAQAFERWVMEEVLPALRKRGYYGSAKAQGNGGYIDARDVPYDERPVNGYNVRHITIGGDTWVSVNDINKAIHASTESSQVVKKLNAKQTLAIKIWLYGNTHPAWFTNELGLKLMLSGSRKLRSTNQLSINFGG